MTSHTIFLNHFFSWISSMGIHSPSLYDWRNLHPSISFESSIIHRWKFSQIFGRNWTWTSRSVDVDSSSHCSSVGQVALESLQPVFMKSRTPFCTRVTYCLPALKRIKGGIKIVNNNCKQLWRRSLVVEQTHMKGALSRNVRGYYSNIYCNNTKFTHTLRRTQHKIRA